MTFDFRRASPAVTADKIPGSTESIASHEDRKRERFVRLAAAIVFLIFFQTYMIAPLIPFLATAFATTEKHVAFAGLALGAASDRFGRRGLLILSLTGFPFFTALTAFASNVQMLIVLRCISGLCNAGIVVMALTLVADLYAGKGRARALGWIFGAIAGGGAFGSTAAGLLAPIIGWRGLFVATAAVGLLIVPLFFAFWRFLDVPVNRDMTWRGVLLGYVTLAKSRRATKTYAFIIGNAMFHSGVFTWLGVLLHDRFGLGETGIGLALLGYGIPGFLFGPLIGRVVDRYGRRFIIPAGFVLAAASAAALAANLPVWIAMLAITGLSLGFDLTHPLLAGIAAGLDDKRRGQALGVNTFSIFLGLGCGSLLFGMVTPYGLAASLTIFAGLQLLAGVASAFAFSKD
jgi:predicted MFS family arabinose efflux permease